MKKFILIIFSAMWILTGINLYGEPFLGENRNQLWIEDIDYLVGRLKVQHPDMYANVTESEFNKKLSDIKAKIGIYNDQQLIFAISELIALIRDAHTGIAPWKSKNKEILENDNRKVYHCDSVKVSHQS